MTSFTTSQFSFQMRLYLSIKGSGVDIEDIEEKRTEAGSLWESQYNLVQKSLFAFRLGLYFLLSVAYNMLLFVEL